MLTLTEVAERARVNKVTAFRILSTLVAKNLVQKVGPKAYKCRFRPFRNKKLLIGYAAQSEVVPFINTVTESLMLAAKAAEIDLMVFNNRGSRAVALRNADAMVERKVDIAIEFQRISDVAPAISERFAKAAIPLIAVDNPHPDSVYFGADNYKAGRIGGTNLGRWALDRWGGKVDEIVLIQSNANPVLEARSLGIYDGIVSALPRSAKSPLYRYDTQACYEKTLDAVRKHLGRSRATRILVGAVNDVSALAALAEFRGFAREEHCAVASQDAVIESRWEMRRPGTRLVGSVAFFPETYGERLIQLAVSIAEKRDHPPAVFTRHCWVAPHNVDRIYPNDLLMRGQHLPWGHDSFETGGAGIS